MDSSKPKQTLNEISHLFLSSVRDLPRPGAPRPMRIPPGGARIEPAPRVNESIDVTPEEFAEMYGVLDLGDETPSAAASPNVTAMLASHLGSAQGDRVRQYAGHCAGQESARIGLIEIEANELRITRFEPNRGDIEPVAPIEGVMDAAMLGEVLVELNADVDRWLMVIADSHEDPARSLMALAAQWTLLCTCDHDGVVAGYRTLKSLSGATRPKLTLALLDVPSVADGAMVHRKLAGVCEQFLNWSVERETDVDFATDASEQLVLHQTASRELDSESPAHWATLQNWMSEEPSAMSNDLEAEVSAMAGQDVVEYVNPAMDEPISDEPLMKIEPLPTAEPAAPARRMNSIPLERTAMPMTQESPRAAAPMMPVVEHAPARPSLATDASPFRLSNAAPVSSNAAMPIGLPGFDSGLPSDVVDLPGGDVSPQSMLSAIVRHQPGALVECPVRAPMCPGAMLAVDRDHGLVLLSVAQAGLSDLRQIAAAYQWMNQNRALLAMAMPQFAIDGHRLPQLRLLVDHRDMTAELLQPMLAVGHVLVQAYRKLRWSGRVGLLLEAA